MIRAVTHNLEPETTLDGSAAQAADAAPAGSGGARRVVVADLDNTLLKTDSLHEQLVRLAFQKPAKLWGLLRAVLRGKAAFKAYCADNIILDPEVLVTCAEVLDFLHAEKAAGARIVLCTAADRRVAEGVAQHLGIFDEVIATDSAVNLKGRAKADALQARFPGGFIYAGDDASDLHVWTKADGIVLAGVSPRVAEQARRLGKPILGEFRPRRPSTSLFKLWARALRVHHWSKNFLLFVPLVLSHRWTDPALVEKTCLAFLLLLAITSASYLINDLADLDSDRRHATKRYRPIASGAIPLLRALTVATATIAVAVALAIALSPAFAMALLAYLVITLAYSFALKRIPLLDTFTIAVLFTTRLTMGLVFLDVAPPVWLLTFSMFFFFSLATAKRSAEIVRARGKGGDSLRSRGYRPEDGPLVLVLGVASGLGSLVILVLYMVDEAFKVVGYHRPEFLWAISLLLAVWIGRLWLLTERGQMNDDPVAFALRDRSSQAIAIGAGICFLLAL